MSGQKKSAKPAPETGVAEKTSSPVLVQLFLDLPTAERLLDLVTADGKGMARQVLTIAMQKSVIRDLSDGIKSHKGFKEDLARRRAAQPNMIGELLNEPPQR